MNINFIFHFINPEKGFNKTINNNRGFSLIELLVSLSIFTIVLTMAVGSLLVVIDANAKAQNMQQVMTNLSFAIDSISREVRTGQGLYCSLTDPGANLGKDLTQDCTSGTYISIVEGGKSLTAGDISSRISFRFNSANHSIDRRIGTGDWFPITAPEVTVTSVNFYVADSTTASNGDNKQANMTIYIKGHAGDLETVDTSFELQTTISRRVLDIY